MYTKLNWTRTNSWRAGVLTTYNQIQRNESGRSRGKGVLCGPENVSMIKKKRKTFVDLIIETTAVRRESHPRSLVEINSHYTLISPDTSLETFEKVAVMATEKYCSAADSVKAKINVICAVRNPEDVEA